MIRPEQSLRAVMKVLGHLQTEQFFGKLTIHLQQGNVVMMSVGQTITPESVIRDGRTAVTVREIDDVIDE
jgi:hypothetical protein